MSARALQRVVVRMLYDPALVDAVYAGEAALADVELTPAERAWLRAPDRRRWAVDPLRRTRGLQALLEAFPVAGAEAAVRFGLKRLDAFFSARAFHGCVQGRGVLAEAFGGWLSGLGSAEVRAAALIERGIDRVRRAPPPGEAPPSPAGWATAPWAFGVALPAGAFDRWTALRAQLTAHPEGPLAALLASAVDVRRAPPLDAGGTEGVVGERVGAGPDDVAVGGAPAALGALLTRLEVPHDWPSTAAALGELGAEPDEVEAVAAGLIRDGLLTSG